MSRSDNSPPAFPIVPKNAYFAALKAQFDAQIETLAETRKLTIALGERKTLLGEEALAKVVEPVVTSLEKLNQTVGRFDRETVDYVTALYAAVIDTTGIVVSNTLPGKWLNNALHVVNKTDDTRYSVEDIAALAKPEKSSEMEKFIKRLVSTAGGFGELPRKMSSEDLLRFVRLAPGVWGAIQLANAEITKEKKPPDSPAATTA